MDEISQHLDKTQLPTSIYQLIEMEVRLPL